MNASERLDDCLTQVSKARNRINKIAAKQIRKKDDLDFLQAVAYSWFRSHRPPLRTKIAETTLNEIDRPYRKVLDSTTRNATKQTYVDSLKAAKKHLTEARSEILLSEGDGAAEATSDAKLPRFSDLVADARMCQILSERWTECYKCIDVGANLSATVMMGGLLETLFVARANQLTDKHPLVNAANAPKDKKTGKTIPLSEWTLRPYIDVGHELGWITKSGKDVAAVLRDYRNYVHPEKQRSHGISVNEHDVRMFWDVTRNLTVQLLGIVAVR